MLASQSSKRLKHWRPNHIDDTTNRIVDQEPIVKKRRYSDKENLRSGVYSSGLIASPLTSRHHGTQLPTAGFSMVHKTTNIHSLHNKPSEGMVRVVQTNLWIGKYLTTPIAVTGVPEDWLSRPLFMARFITLGLDPWFSGTKSTNNPTT